MSDTESSDSNSTADSDEEDLPNEFKEKIITFIKLDDMARAKKQELNNIKESKKPVEEFILKYLEKIKEKSITVNDNKLIRNKSETKGSLKQDIIKDSIREGIHNKQIDDYEKITDDILELMDQKRPMVVHVNLKRKMKKNKKTKAKAAKVK